MHTHTHTISIGQKTHYYKDSFCPNIDLLIQYNSSQNPNTFYGEIGKPILKFIQIYKGPRVGKANFRKKDKVEENALLGSNSYYKTAVVKMVSYRHKDRKNRMEQNRIQKYVREVGKKIVANLKTTKHKRKS